MSQTIWDNIPKAALARFAASITRHNDILKRLAAIEEPRRAMLPSTPPMLDWPDDDEDDY